MKEECKLCSVNAWEVPVQSTTDFSISSLMRPTAHPAAQMDPRHDAVLLSAYLFKLGDYPLYSLHDYYANLGYYQPAGPLIKETGSDAERALARYHPQPHYHPPHPPVLQQYGPPYYPAELCYGRYYRPPGPYHLPPQPSADGQIVGVGSESYPPPRYYSTPPCYQHSPQRIPYVEYPSCPCPLNACPKNVLIGPATGKAPAGGGPTDLLPALAPPGGAFRPKVRACLPDAAADTHGSGKDPPIGPEPPAAADAPHPCPLPTIGGASPKRELYDVRETLRVPGDVPGSAEAIGPPSPARGSAGACAPQPPPLAQRRARLGKDMARRSLAGDDTGLLMSNPPNVSNSDGDDDVLAISPPVFAPIDLSSSDERSTPLVDVKKENDGPMCTTPRKPDAQALKEINCTTTLKDVTESTGTNKSVKRRYSKPNLEIEMKDVQLEESCRTNGIGEHVKLQKRRKVSSEQLDVVRTETSTKEPKKKSPQKKLTSVQKKTVKRKSETLIDGPDPKKSFVDKSEDNGIKQKKMNEESASEIIKMKSALLLDNLIKKNSFDRPDAKISEKGLNPAELFLSPSENIVQSCKKTLNINNNVVENHHANNGVRPNTLAAVNKMIEKKMAHKNSMKLEKIDSKITHTLKSVLKSPTEMLILKEENKIIGKNESCNEKLIKKITSDIQFIESVKEGYEPFEKLNIDDEIFKSAKVEKLPKKVDKSQNAINHRIDRLIDESQHNLLNIQPLITDCDKHTTKDAVDTFADKNVDKKILDKPPKRHKSCSDAVGKGVEKVAKLLVSKKSVVKVDEANLVVEEACASPTPSINRVGKRSRRRRSGAHNSRRVRRAPAVVELLDLEPRAPPRWSNGWNWDGEPYISKVYLNNDSRLDRTARCWPRMRHAGGDRVARGDCVLLRASAARAQPFVARIARLWENPDDGEMMVSLVWYYRPEHTELGRQPADAPDEVFASRHRDANSVACIEDKCYVLTYNEYCRYRKRLKAAEEGIIIAPSIVPPLPITDNNSTLLNDSKLPLTISPELVLFCRKIYDFRSKKLQMPTK